MAKFSLPIKSTYVPDWGAWEAIRELIQNAKDEEEQNDHEMRVRHKGKLLRIENRGADMGREVLLLGQTSKAGRANLRGQFGEGLNLALLAGVRAGLDIVVYTQTERWSASLEPSSDYGNEECLVVTTRKLQKRRKGVEVQVTMTKDEWEEFRKLFLFLVTIPDNRIVRTEAGSILLEPERKGHVYAKGIFIQRLDKLELGYDLHNCPLDRDRRMVDVWDLQWKLSMMYQEAVSKRPELLGAEVYRMLRDNAEDTRQLKYNASDKMAADLANHFVAEHGEDAIPVGSIAESQELDHVGKRGVVVPETLRVVLAKKMGTPAEVREEILRTITETFAWSDLNAEERAILQWTASTIDSVSEGLRGNLVPIMERLEIVTFRDQNLLGTCVLESGAIRVTRTCLADPQKLFRTLVHEEAHAIADAGDGTKDHVDFVEELWVRLYFAKPRGN
jgi:hypothetical protein